MRTFSGLIALMAIIGFAVVGCSSPTEGDPTASGTSTSTDAGTPTADAFAMDAVPLLTSKCVGCHSGDKPKANVDMSKFKTMADAKANAEVIHKMAEEVKEGKMPPKGTVAMTDDERAKLVAALEAAH